MRVAALYDIHGMLEPLEAVLRELEDEQFDTILIGGDAISGPQPTETFELLRSLETPMHWICGNGERALGPDAGDAVIGDAEEALRFTASFFSDDERTRLSSLPGSVTLDVDGLGETLFCHASPRNDLDILTPGTPDDRFRALLDGVPQRVVVAGHTHMQLDRSIDGVRWVNPGSVGMPYEGEVAAFSGRCSARTSSSGGRPSTSSAPPLRCSRAAGPRRNRSSRRTCAQPPPARKS